MNRIWSLTYHRVAWTIGAALLAGVAAQVMLALLLKALGLLHSGSLHTWLLDVGHNMGPLGAAGGLGAAAAAASSPPPPKDKDPDPCAGEARAVLADQGTVDMYKGQIKSAANQINQLATPMTQLLDQASALAPAAQSEVENQFVLSAITELVQLVAKASGLGEGAEAVSSAVGLVTNPAGAVVGAADTYGIVEDAKFLTEMYKYFQVSQGDLNALEELCKENPLPAASHFLNVMEELKQNIAQGYTLVNDINQYQNQLQEAQNKLSQDQQALADCQKSNSGGGGSGGGDSGGGDAGGDA